MVAMLYNRCETATFAKIKQGVQEMMHKYVERLWRFLLPGAAVASFKASPLGETAMSGHNIRKIHVLVLIFISQIGDLRKATWRR